MKMKVVIQISRRKSLELTMGGARALYESLHEMFGRGQPAYVDEQPQKADLRVVDDYGTEVK